MDSTQHSQIRILGKKSTHREIAEFLKKEVDGDGIKPGKSKSEISQNYGISRPTINKYLKLADELEIQTTYHKKTVNNNITLSDSQFLENPYVVRWVENMKARTPSGKQFGGMKQYINGFYAVCKTLKVNPEIFISGSTIDEVLKNGRTLTQNFLEQYKQKKAEIRYKKNWNLEDINMESVRYSYSKYIRDFMKINGFSYPAGETGVMSQSINALHGKYSDIKIPENIHQEIKNNLISTYGLDSDEFRFYVYGIEAFPRYTSLFNTPSNFKKVELPGGKIIFETENYESKTSQYKRGIWKKHIFDLDLQESITRVSKRSQFLIEERNFTKFDDKIKKILRNFYSKYNLTSQGQSKLGDPNSSYFIKKPIHSLRHAGAQRLLLASNWSISYVSKRGWKTAQELVDSYGEMPIEQELKTMENITF